MRPVRGKSVLTKTEQELLDLRASNRALQNVRDEMADRLTALRDRMFQVEAENHELRGVLKRLLLNLEQG